MIVEVSGHLGLENGLVVPGKFTASTKSSSAVIGQKLNEKIPHIKELCKLMEMHFIIYRNSFANRLIFFIIAKFRYL